MTNVTLLKEIEDFLRSDLSSEKLSSKVRSKKNALLTKVSGCINSANEQEKVDQFLAKQRKISRLESQENEKSKILSDEDDGDYYMDLTDICDSSGVGLGIENMLVPPATDDYGSGSGYEDYESDEDSSAREKKNKEEDLNPYFSNAGCDIYTYIFFENKGKFLSGKKWVKRIGIVKENHLKCYKKPNDSTAVLDIPLRAYNATLKNKEGTSSMLITLSAGSDSDAHRFYVERDNTDEWFKILKEKTLSFIDTREASPPPVAARPSNTLPRPSQQENFGNSKQQTGVQRASSVGVADHTKSCGDISIFITDFGTPPVPPGHPSISPTTIQLNYIGKGFKSAMSDMFKKDKIKKRITAAENLGAAVCGYLMVHDKNWTKKWCLVKANQLLIYGKEEAPELQIELQGCDLLPYSDDPDRQFGFKIIKNGKEVVFMEASSSDEMGKWIGVLIAETGLAEMPMSEPEYMSIELRKSLMLTAKQAFKSRRDTISGKKTDKSVFPYTDADGEELYVDLSPENQSTPIDFCLENAVTSSTSGKISLDPTTEKDKKNKKAKKTLKQSDLSDSKSSSGDKKEKQKDKKKEKEVKRTITSPTLMTTIDARPNLLNLEVLDPLDGSKTLPAKSTTLPTLNSKAETRQKKISEQKADIKIKLPTLRVKKDELNKYIQASGTESEKGRLRIMLRKVTEEHSKLEKEEIALELELKKIKDGNYDIESPANKRPQTRQERKPINTGASGNVLSKAQMWETGNKK